MRLVLSQILLFAFFSGIVVTPNSAKAAWPWSKSTEAGMEKYSPEWWAYTSSLPVGSRQKYRFGKQWPNRPRPVEPQQPFMQQFHASHFWPTPYNHIDRNIVEVFDEAHISKGWKNATTLYEYHFDPVTNQLNKSGRVHLLWIMNTAAPNRRSAYVQASTEKYINDQRLASVSNYISETAGPAAHLPVMLDARAPVTRPAVEVQRYNQMRLENLESPRIPYNVEASGGGEGG